ncbi:hypothetical protein [Sedimentibacter sp. MB31-C6]|uniref:hypothetical protein n=1 Tax=Sedimentibacter sp. MB31-C6 TaxID=3109366 RepID=UPI002DDCA9C4|nr:hypothetical protein [Sedimentibacter sp. MB36-C1]WSI04032.1 hypothetical protein U8307_13680 [Sedimentibacter sp. MB36-C1]
MNKKNYDLAVGLRHELHEHPEVSNNEVWTKKHLIEFLKKYTNLIIVDKGCWFYAIYKAKEGKKNIAFRADFDAIPMDEYLDIPHGGFFPETYNHAESADKVRKASKNKGYRIVELKEAKRSSEDFGYYTKLTKGAIFRIGNGEDYPDIHTNEFDFRDELIEIAVDLFKEIIETE